MADQRILRGVAASLSWQPVDSSGEAADPGATVTVGVVTSAGTEVLAPGTSTSGSGASPRTVALTAAQTADLDLLTATWTVGSSIYTTTAEIVGGFYFTIAQARSSDPSLRDDTRFPTDSLVTAREAVEDEFERICGVAFVPRFSQEIAEGAGVVRVKWPRIRTVRSIEAWSDDAWTATTDLASYVPTEQGSIIGEFRCDRRYRIAYEHGYDQPPGDVVRVAKARLRNIASQPTTGIPDRATSYAITDGGVYALDKAGPFKTGIPEVDGVLGRYDQRTRIA
jgi:hypothetical protein